MPAIRKIRPGGSLKRGGKAAARKRRGGKFLCAKRPMRAFAPCRRRFSMLTDEAE